MRIKSNINFICCMFWQK